MTDTTPTRNHKMIEQYLMYQREQERSKATLQKYRHDLNALLEYLNGTELTKTALIGWKEQLVEKYAPASVNAMLAAANGYVRFMGWMDLTVKWERPEKTVRQEPKVQPERMEPPELPEPPEHQVHRERTVNTETIPMTP